MNSPYKNRRLARPMPFIPRLTEDSEIDVEALGSEDLETYVKYAGMQDGDEIRVRWRGCNAAGVAFDDLGSVSTVIDFDPTLGMLVPINNRILVETLGGAGFYSYAVNGDPEESDRTFCLIGLRTRPVASERLPVVQVTQSHDLVIALDELGSTTTVTVAPYQAMRNNDEVTLIFQGYDDEDFAMPEKTYPLLVDEAQVGQPMQWAIPRSQFLPLGGGRVELHYEIQLQGGLVSVDSPPQVFRVMASGAGLSPRLAEVQIDGYSGGDLDPSTFPTGLTLRIPHHDGAQPGDHVMLYWDGSADSFVHSQRLDASSVEGSEVVFSAPAAWLEPGELTLSYQLARQGLALSAQPLSVQVVVPRVLSAPSMEASGSDGATNQVFAMGENLGAGAWINVPASVQLRPDETLNVHWDGHPNGGRYTATAPADPSKPLRFLIPPAFVAPNMEATDEGTAKRFDVTYQILPGGSRSDPLRVRIKPVPIGRYSHIVCDEAEGNGDLLLSELKGRPATLILESWIFMNIGQKVKIWISGNGESGAISEMLRDAVEVDETEMSTGFVYANIPFALLERFKRNSSPVIHVTVSFDDVSDTKFLDRTITIRD